ncbi:MAG: class I SAM-dependent methyltransferase [Acidimicrobiaceae bacterium]|nr:class I SAM-dependent methyltransferase [Acidimicrobiaceae bacterium]
MDWEAWQQRWDRQQEVYLPDREARFAAMLDVVEAARGSEPRVLDLAGGTGSISRRVLARFPKATTVILDVDPALLAIATGSFQSDERVTIRAADLDDPSWVASAGAPDSFDAVLTATALHWLTPERIRAVYAEAAGLLRPGGVFANADHMADEGLAGLNEAVARLHKSQVEHSRAGGRWDWERWWEELAAEPEMAELIAQRNAHFAAAPTSSHTRSYLSSSWHLDALRAAGYEHAGLAWRGLADALAVGVRA